MKIVVMGLIVCSTIIVAKPLSIKFRDVKTTFDCGTHMAPLITAICHTSGPVLELGCGDFSTPLLHVLCQTQRRFLLTLETNRSWMFNFLDLETVYHVFRCGSNLLDFICKNTKHWSVVFVDHYPPHERGLSVKVLRDKADVFVLHDSESSGYGYNEIVPSFKYVYVYERYATTTTIISDVFDVASWFEE